MDNSKKSYQDIWLNNLKKIIHPQKATDTLNSYFIDKVEVEKNKSKDTDK
jgi:hypothetical protein